MVGGFSPPASQRLAARLITAGENLATFPHRGTPISDGRRQLSTVAPYLIRYRVLEGKVIILEVRHGAENAP